MRFAERRREWRQLLDGGSVVGFEREEGEAVVVDGGDFVEFLGFGNNLQAGVEAVETGEIGLGADDVEHGEILDLFQLVVGR